ncbi:MAG: hypothetical protein JWM91_1095 [Rhodospirillales bacterium]|nr:hypothetical protein [Rhodospirillales bacterium]
MNLGKDLLLKQRTGRPLVFRRRSTSRTLLFLTLLMLQGWCVLAPAPVAAQNLSQILGNGSSGSGSSDVTGEIFRALQQRLTGQSTVPSLQPDIQIQNPPTYPPQSTVPGALGNSQRSQQNFGPMSPIERLMSQRAGQPIRQFGYEIFGRGAPVIVRQSGALQDNYVLGEGDEIVLTLRGQQNSSFRTRVDRDGRVVFPALPPISGSGRPFGAFRTDLEAAARHAITGTEVLVSVGAVRQISVRVVGEVNSPGLFSLSGISTAMDALSLAGGVKNTGSLRDIQIVRGGNTIRLDLYTLLTGQANGADVTLTEGDRIVVPLQRSAVAVAGQVKRPAIYELPPGQNAALISDVLGLAGGPEVRGSYRFSILRTRGDGKREMVRVGTGSNVAVYDSDIVFVAATADVSLARVELMGATALNGYYPLNTAHSLSRLLNSLDMFSPTAGKPLPYLLLDAIIRLDPSTMQRKVIPFSPVDVLEGKADLKLQSNDLVYIMNVAEMRYIAHRAATAQRIQSRRIVSDHPDTGAQNPPAMESALASAVAGRGQPSPANNPSSTIDVRAAELAALQGRQGVPQLTTPSGIQGMAGRQALTGNLGGLGSSPNQSFGAFAQDQATAETQGQGPPESEAERLNPGILVPAEYGIPNQALDRVDERDLRDTARTPAGQAMVPGASFSNREPLRLFVGLDDDTRHLLVSTLGNYYVTAVGELNNPGDFLAMPQTSLANVVQAAGGLTPKVDLHAFEITSAVTDNASGVSHTVRRNYDLPVSLFSQVSLNLYDRIRFNSVFSDRDSGDVSVVGEIKYPGGYEILRGEHLSSVLARAGGFTDAAYPSGAIFLRRSVAEEQRGVAQREADALERQVVGIVGTVSNKARVTDAEIAYIGQMIERLRQGGDPGGRVAVEIDPREIAAHPELDVVMEPGDQLFIPRRPSSVVIAGEVMSPGGIQFRADRSVSTYVALAGGLTEIADEDHMFVIQPDGSAVRVNGDSWLSEPPELAPGSVIVVPRKLRHFTWDSLLEDVIQVTSQAAITAASLSVISR